MAHFGLENNIANVLRTDAPFKHGPVPRWQRKALETSSTSINNSLNVSVNQSLSKSPTKTPGRKTPGKSKSPGRNRAPSTPGDRFIPNRSGTKFDVGHFKLTQDSNITDDTESPSKLEYKKIMSENLNHPDASNVRIMAYQGKAPKVPEGSSNHLRVIYSQSKTPGSARKSTRHIPQSADRVLDAPGIIDDYYLNLLDWSAGNLLAVALSGQVYIWNSGSGDITCLFELEDNDEYITSVSWIKDGNSLAVGNSLGEVQLWDVDTSKRLRVMRGHSARVAALSWNSHILSSGARDGRIHHHDVRVAQHHVGSYVGHMQEICGLQWSPDGRYLASGGNDNLLNIWANDTGRTVEESGTIHTFRQHQSAVKAVSWCPWQPGILASGGGTSDRNIKLWNCNSGSCVNTVDARSQVCSILWSKEYRELISGHGFANNQLIIWKYPTMEKVTELTGHHARILHMSMSPDKTTVISAAADETLRLWKCFAVDPKKKKSYSSSKSSGENTVLSLRKALR